MKSFFIMSGIKQYGLQLAYGGAPYKPWTVKIIRCIREGCANRPFFQIAVQEIRQVPKGPIIEQVGVYDPLPNKYNEKVVAFNFARIHYWLGQGAMMSVTVKKLLGLSGFFPIHPDSYKSAWQQRELLLKTLKELESLKAQKTENNASKNSSSD